MAEAGLEILVFTLSMIETSDLPSEMFRLRSSGSDGIFNWLLKSRRPASCTPADRRLAATASDGNTNSGHPWKICNVLQKETTVVRREHQAAANSSTYVCWRERWMEEQIVSDMLISSVSLMVRTIKVWGQELVPQRHPFFSHSSFFPPLGSSCREPFQSVTEIKETTSLDKLPPLIIRLKMASFCMAHTGREV